MQRRELSERLLPREQLPLAQCDELWHRGRELRRLHAGQSRRRVLRSRDVYMRWGTGMLGRFRVPERIVRA